MTVYRINCKLHPGMSEAALTLDLLTLHQVDYYGAQTPLRQLAGISVPDNSMLVIQPYDQASVKAIERGIVVSDLGLTPNNDGKLIRLNIPQLTAV